MHFREYLEQIGDKAFSEKLAEKGIDVSPKYVARWRLGYRVPPGKYIETILSIANGLVSVSDIYRPLISKKPIRRWSPERHAAKRRQILEKKQRQQTETVFQQ